MRVFAIVSLVQIAGILGSPIVQDPKRTENKESRRIKLLQNLFNAIDFGVLNNAPDHMRILGRMKCRTIGGPDAENAAVEREGVFHKSFVALTNETKLQLETASDALHGGLDSAVDTACRWALNTDSLIRNLTDTLKRCWSPEECVSIDLMHNILSAMLQYVCQNNGSRVSAFLTADGADCIDSSKMRILSCLDTSFCRDIPNYVHVDNNSFNPPWGVPIITLNTETCREFDIFQQCTVEVLRGCQHSTPSSEINSLFNTVKKSSGCEDFLKI